MVFCICINCFANCVSYEDEFMNPTKEYLTYHSKHKLIKLYEFKDGKTIKNDLKKMRSELLKHLIQSTIEEQKELFNEVKYAENHGNKLFYYRCI